MSDLNALLDAERLHLESEQRELQEQIRQQTDRLALVKTRLEHVRALLGIEQDPKALAEDGVSSIRTRNNRTSTICDIAVAVLSERNTEPMHYKDLAHEVIKRGGVINGTNPGAGLTARMVQDERFVRPTAKGFYALRRDYPTARNVGARLKNSRTQQGGRPSREVAL